MDISDVSQHTMTTALLWFRRDLRLADHPALTRAVRDFDRVVPVFVLDDALRNGRFASAPREAFMLGCLRALDADLRERGSGLVVRDGPPEHEIPALAGDVNADAVLWTSDVSPYARARDRRVTEALRANSIEPLPQGGGYVVDVSKPRTQGARRYLRPVTFAGATDERLDDAILERTGKPLVYLTFGTVFSDYPAFPVAVAAIHDAGVGAVVTVGPNADPASLGEQPSRVVVKRYVRQTLLLPECDVVASHAGSGSALAALSMGIPQLCMPQAADQFLNAAAIAHAGAGISIHPHDVDRAGVALAIRRLLDEDHYRDAARRIADEIAAMPSPDEVAAELEALA